MYTLPSMSRADIISTLSEFQINDISETDLINPNPNHILKLYSSLLQYLNILDDPNHVDFGAAERLDNPEMHKDAAAIINLFKQIKNLLKSIECPFAFRFNDFITPDPNRTLKFLTAIINFSLYRDSKLSLLSSYASQLVLLEEQQTHKESRNLQLKEEIQAIKEEREQEQPIVQEAEAKVKELRQAVDNLNSLQLNLRKERQTLKEKAQELTNNVSTAEFELIQASEENAILRSKIVQSPDKLQRALEDKKAVLIEAKDSERLSMQHFQEKAAILEVYTKASQKMTKQLAQTQAIQEQVNSAKSVEKDVKQLKSKLSDEQMLEISLEAKVTECDARAEQFDKEKRQLEKEANLRRDEDTRGLNNVRLEAESKRHDLEARERKIETVSAEADAIKQKINSVKELASVTQLELIRKSEEIVNEVNSYSGSIFQVMQNQVAAGTKTGF